jgi:dTDP-4-amino-4,6-dideoxygalactose transaminase
MKRLTLGSSSIGDLEKQYVAQVLDDNYISPGKVVKEVEETCAKLHGFKHGLALNSGQSAIHLAIQAIVETRLNRRDDEKPLVAVPACTYISTLAAAILAGCDIVLVDVDRSTGNMSDLALQKVLQEQRDIGDPVDIVVPAHLYGQACSQLIFETCRIFNCWVVEDACEATFVKGVGHGHILTTSFFSNHLISGGGGGLIMTDDSQLDEYCWKLVNHGRSSRFGNEDIHRIADKFHFDTWGHSMKWNDVSAAIVKAQIERRDELYEARRRNAAVLDDILAHWSPKKVWLPYGQKHSYMMYPIILSDFLDANNVIRYLNDHGIEIRRLMPITNQPVVQKYFNSDLAKEFPNANYLNKQGFYVGVHPELSQEDMEEMGSIIDEAIRLEVNRTEGSND